MMSLLSRSGDYQMTDKLSVSVILHFIHLFFVCCFSSQGHGRSLLGEWQIRGGSQREGRKTLQCVY